MNITSYYVFINGEQVSTESSLEDAILAGGTGSFEIWANGKLSYVAQAITEPRVEITREELNATAAMLDRILHNHNTLWEKEADALRNARYVLKGLAADCSI